MIFDVAKEYSREDFEDFIRDFLPEDFEPAEEEIYIDKKNIVSSFRLGNCESLDLTVFEFRTKKSGDPRVTLTAEARDIMKKYGYQPNALAAFYNEESKSWRLSLITTDYETEIGTGKKKITYSNPRRFSFLLGAGCKRHTPEEMLISKGQVRERTENGRKLSPFEDLKSRFDIEIVTKEFYNELFSWYEWACSLAKYPSGRADKVSLTSSNNETSLIRLITRLIFVWFIKQKDLVPSWIFDENELGKILAGFNSQSLKSGNYYNAVMQNLFFATLNKKIEERKFTDDNEAFKHYGIKTFYRDDKENSFFKISHGEVVEKFKSVPFLNGGLFECLDRLEEGEGGKNEQIYEDGFSREEKRRAFLPDALFFQKQIQKKVQNNGQEHEGIVHILNRYNFTVEENTPSDVQVALDPELLGKVFENLLGTYNPETSETARKDSGSFYTPREIVRFMVNESLISYLIDVRSQTLEKEMPNDYRLMSNKIRHFVENEDASQFSDNEKEEIVKKLENIKVLDPACGSGAFPVGMLQKLVSLICQANCHAELDSASSDKIASPSTRNDENALARNGENALARNEENAISQNDKNANSDYKLKLHLIENCLYGVDIQTIAVQICKLRFFITLICEQDKTEDEADNYGFNPLPNLETKFVAADSLVSLAKNADKDLAGELFADPEIPETKNALQETRRKHFSAPNAAMKKKYREDDKKLREKLAKLLAKDNMYDNRQAKQLADWNPYDQNAVSSFFDAEWMFGVSDGFDIVLGNPPYIQLQKDGGKLAKKYESEEYKSYAKTGDIYCLFYERGFNLLKNGGHLCFITSNKWMRAGYGEKLRGFLSKNVNPQILIDFAGVKIFDSATVDTDILLFEKGKNKNKTLACVTKNLTKDGLNNLSEFVQQNSALCSFAANESWVVLSPIEQSIKAKIEKAGVPLKDWDIQIYRGILTGYNDAFIITTEKRNEILAACKSVDEKKRTEELIRPILRGRDIKRYGYDWAGLWLIATFPSRHYDIEKYPAVKNHLLSFGIKRLEQTGKEYVVNGEKIKARKKTNNKWFETQDSISYWEDFSKPKIVWGNLNLKASYALAPAGMFVNAPCPMIVPASRSLLFILNSKLADYYIRKLGVTRNGGYFEYKPMFIEQLPVPKSVDESLFKKFSDSPSEKEQQQIDSLVYKLYGLSQDEIAFIENQ